MDLFKLGKDVQALKNLAQSIDENIGQQPQPLVERPFTTFPCVPRRTVYDDFENNALTTSLRAYTIVSNASRNGDYVVATVSSVPITNERGDDLGTNVYLVNPKLQSMVLLADRLTRYLGSTAGRVELLYGIVTYNNADFPIIFGVKASWAPQPFDFGNAGAGLMVSLAARLTNSCDLWIRAEMKPSFADPATLFRAGSEHTQQKLDSLAEAYFRAAYSKFGFQEIELDADVLKRMQFMSQ